MTEFIKTHKNIRKTQKERELIVSRNSNESYKTQSPMGQNASVQWRFYAEAIELLGEKWK